MAIAPVLGIRATDELEQRLHGRRAHEVAGPHGKRRRKGPVPAGGGVGRAHEHAERHLGVGAVGQAVLRQDGACLLVGEGVRVCPRALRALEKVLEHGVGPVEPAGAAQGSRGG